MMKKSLACIPLAVAGAALTASAGTAPMTVPLIAGALLTGAASNLFNKSLETGAERLGSIFGGQRNASDPILTVLRQAHLDALATILKKFDNAYKTGTQKDADSERFSRELHAFIKRAGKSLKSVKPSTASSFEQNIFAILPNALDSLQANAAQTPSSETTANAANTLQAEFSELVLKEVVAESGSTEPEVPVTFKRLFSDPDHGWLHLFALNARDALIQDDAFKSLWTVKQLQHIKTLNFTILQKVEAVAEELHHHAASSNAQNDQMSAKLDKILALTAAEKGIDPEHIRPILERLGHTNTPIDQMHTLLAHAVDELLKRAESIEKTHNDGTLIDQAIHAARQKLRSADVDGANSILDSAITRAQDQLAQHKKSTARLFFEKAFLKQTTFAYAEAIENYQTGLDLDPDNLICWDALASTCQTIGQSGLALDAVRRCLDLTSERAAADPENCISQSDLSVSYERIGDILAAQGKLGDALTEFQKGLVIRKTLANADPENTEWQRNLSVSRNRIGDILVVQGKPGDALTQYHKGLEIAENLSIADPENAGWQRDLSVSCNRIGDILAAQGKLDDALTQYHKGLEIAEDLSNTDPENTGWQRDLSVCYDRIGCILFDQGKFNSSLRQFQKGLEIVENRSNADPENTQCQRDISISYDRIGGILVAQGKLDDALIQFQIGLEIAENLANADPENTEWQRDLIISNVKISQLDSKNARNHLTVALTIAQGLAETNRLSPSDEWMLSDLQDRLNKLA